ncbi:MAG: hypothetical protein QM809_07795 [Gordonia sp. (in: high G+C Gram-positive bacteria)]
MTTEPESGASRDAPGPAEQAPAPGHPPPPPPASPPHAPGQPPAGHPSASFQPPVPPAPPPSSSKLKPVLVGSIVIAVLLVVALIVTAVFVFSGEKDDASSQATEGTVSSDIGGLGDPRFEYLVGADGKAPTEPLRVVVTVISDYQCPACKYFEANYAGLLDQLRATTVTAVRYIPVSFLNRMSDDDYSSRAWNASVCVADSRAGDSYTPWLTYHRRLFDHSLPRAAPGCRTKPWSGWPPPTGSTPTSAAACGIGRTTRGSRATPRRPSPSVSEAPRAS